MNSKYKNKDSIVLENASIRAEFLPDPGGKMVSLINKKTGYEYLLQRGNEVYLDQPFDGDFVKGECAGFDDMFPTIDVCGYENEPWKDVKMADHGEVWSLPWHYELKNDALYLSVDGVRFPYTMEKNVCFIGENSIRVDYTLTNNSAYDFEFLWAGHLMINMEEGMRVVVPGDCKQAITILTNTGREFGELQDWPDFKDGDGNIYRADISRPENVKGFEKYYFNNKLADGWCRLEYPGNENKLTIAFPVDTVPYLGLLMNEKGWDNLYNIIVEPCTICYDRPDVAKKHGQVSKVAGFGKYNWYVHLTI
ncbi:MAG: hypothetical protein ABIQ31_24745 [Ferruginibacter sp.]